MTDRLKQYQGKDRIYVSVPRAPRISRLWVWNAERGEYLPPPSGKCYFARRYKNGAREYKFFASVEKALQSRPMHFAELMASLGSKDGREVVLALDALRETGRLSRGRDGEWTLTK